MKMRTLLGLGALVALAAVLPIDGLFEYVIGAVSFGGMALQTVFPTGDQARHLISADWDGTQAGIATAEWTPIDGLGQYNRSNQANTTEHAIYGRQPIITVGAPNRTVTISGWIGIGDAGQDLLNSHAPGGTNAGQSLGYMYLRDGSNGYALMVNVGGGDESSSAEGGLQPTSWTLAPQTDQVAVTDFGD